MRKSGLIVIVLLLIVASLILWSLFKIKPVVKEPAGESTPSSGELATQKPQTQTPEDNETTGTTTTSAGGGGGGGGGGGETPPTGSSLPPDLYTASCGRYFEKYGICTGSCPDGTCTQEGRSCYCKIV